MSAPVLDLYSARGVWNAYQSAVIAGGLVPMPDHWYRSNREALSAVGEFCRENSLIPERWIRAKHDAVGWRFRLRVKDLARGSEAFIAKFNSWGDGMQAEAQSQERLATQVVENRAPDGMPILSEATKRALQLDPEVCAQSDLTIWHASSPWCLACPLSALCGGQTCVGR